MTLIAFATYGKRAELITDSTSYTSQLETLGRCTKHITLNHLDAAVMTQGASILGDHVKSAALQLSGECATFDELVQTMPRFIVDLHRQFVVDPGLNPEATVVLVGWSDPQEKFVGYVLASESAFEPVETRGLWMLPSPYTYLPSDLELDRVARWRAADADPQKWLTMWSRKPKRDKPRVIEDWCEVAQDARDQRANGGTFAHVLVAGDITHTRLERGSVVSQRIMTFNDQGDEFLQIISGTQHPLALAQDCYCSSGASFGTCHGAGCPCGSGSLVWDCCAPQMAKR